jgi:hypothetical protein
VVVAGSACSDDIFPLSLATAAAWDDVVDRNFAGFTQGTAVLTLAAVTEEDVFARAFYEGVTPDNSDICFEANNTWKGKGS